MNAPVRPIIMYVWPQNFAEKTLTDGSETAKNEKVFSLESFPLYGIAVNNSSTMVGV